LNDLPKISIVMPSLNQVQYVEEAILSVVRQDYPRLEFLVIDGGSTDGTLEIIENYKDRIDCSVSEPDRCQNHAVNKGLLRATGDYIGWLNSDDKYEAGALMKVGRYLNKYPDVDLLYAQAAQIDANGKILGWHAEPYNKNRLFHYRDFIPTQACFFRRECLSYVGLFDTALRWNGDWDMWRRIAKYYKVAYLDEHVGNWRIYHGTMSYGKSVDYLAKELETIYSARKHSDRMLTAIELKIWPWVVIDFFRLRPFLRWVHDRTTRLFRPHWK
jgi:glycosyltransferase involved in cell wall biosynthesis